MRNFSRICGRVAKCDNISIPSSLSRCVSLLTRKRLPASLIAVKTCRANQLEGDSGVSLATLTCDDC